MFAHITNIQKKMGNKIVSHYMTVYLNGLFTNLLLAETLVVLCGVTGLFVTCLTEDVLLFDLLHPHAIIYYVFIF